MSKASGLQKRFRKYLKGPGGLKCPCCGAVYNAGKTERRQAKQALKAQAND
jgi:hypothetical protein